MTVQVHPGGTAAGLADNAGRQSLWVAALVALCVVLVFASAWDGLADLYRRWAYEEEYGYGFVAAAIVPILLWKNWNYIKSTSNDSVISGVWVLLAAEILAVFGTLAQSYFVEQVGLVTALLGLAVVVAGTGPLRLFLALYVILLLTIPMPYTLQAILTLKLQLISTDIGVWIIQLLGIPVFSEGNVIDLGIYKLQVAEACSGLRYLLPLTCISFMLACVYQAPMWKRAIIFASAPLITVLINSFRIAVIAVLVNRFGSQMAEGFLHQFEGWVIFLFGAALLIGEIVVLERFRVAGLSFDIFGNEARPKSDRRLALRTRPVLISVGACCIAAALVGAITWQHSHTASISREVFSSFPRQLGNWNGREGRLDPDVLSILKATDYYVGDFAQSGPQSVNLFVAYYDALSKGAAIHSPRVCLPGAGWEFAAFEERPFTELSTSTPGTFNRVVIQKGEDKILMYYWYDQRDRRTANEFMMKLYLLIDSVRVGRSDGALVRIYTPVSNGQGALAAADGRLKGFAAQALPALARYLPN
jgi:exosortase D (VPLPA-CTERM-specific)